MKKIIYFVSACLLLVFASCSKSFDAQNDDATGSKTVEYSIVANAPGYDAASTKADLGAVARVYWKDDDIVDVYQFATDGGIATTKLGHLKASGTSAEKGKTTFSGTINEPASGNKLLFVYPGTDDDASLVSDNKVNFSLASQSYKSSGRVAFCAYGTAPYSSTSATASSTSFKLASSFMNVTVKDCTKTMSTVSSAAIKNINPTVVLQVNGNNIEVQTPGESNGTISIAYTEGPSFVNNGTMISFAVPASAAADSRTISVNGGNDVYFSKVALSAATFYSTAVSVTIESVVLSPGVFTVASGKTVKFAKSNLYWNGSAFKFEPNPWDYPTSWSTFHVGHFYWTKIAANSVLEAYADGDKTLDDHFFADGSDANHKLTVEGIENLYVLTSAEYTYLIETRSASTINGTENAKFAKVKINTSTTATPNYNNGLLLFPDIFTWTSDMGTAPSNINKKTTVWDSSPTYTSAQFEKISAAGGVFIPAAGFRTGNSLSVDESRGHVWSSSLHTSNVDRAYYLLFKSDGVSPTSNLVREGGRSVRLVRDIQ